uniref:Uncharacterized protein n=1 Tax=Rhizophora mucronata TaxID=61149 RepID=A0A2P2JHX1_RHIMU
MHHSMQSHAVVSSAEIRHKIRKEFYKPKNKC